MRYRRSSSTPEACLLVELRERAISSTPEACGLVSIIRAEAHRGWLPGWRHALELVAEILEVVRADAQFLHFLNDRQEISQRTDGAQRLGIGAPYQAARRRQHERVFDHAHGDTALEELRSQHSVRMADGPRRARRFAIRFQDLMNVLVLAVVHG